MEEQCCIDISDDNYWLDRTGRLVKNPDAQSQTLAQYVCSEKAKTLEDVDMWIMECVSVVTWPDVTLIPVPMGSC